MHQLMSFAWNSGFNFAARLGVAGLVPRRIERDGDLLVARFVGGSRLHFVAERRIRLYSRGYAHRLARVASRYGAGEHFHIAPGQVVVDVGANVGEFTLHAAEAGADVFAIEPDRRNWAALARNTEQFGTVRCIQLACAEADGEATFYAFPEGADSSLIEPDNWSASYSVPTRRLDRLLLENGITHVDVMKCDAEGAEPEVLKGALEVLPFVRVLVIDVSPERNGTSTANACEAILTATGARVEYFHKGRILVAKRD
ncbi:MULTISPECIES: FkbM family methyltransferase [unclassified Roseitalea]|uniref:FkbM family methyltransferase n=1 Tax=unclassified Roseitalea TaxID=2639107 RepID=UPI00273FBC01|nr:MULTISPECIES: FkbM family methyltransferase [unclassified Roseitalea]